MDDQSLSMGGKKTFFVKNYEKYSWKNIMDNKTSGIERVQLYSDFLEKMYYNPNISEVFREIFKNSTLPYKEPSVLNLFLKEIGYFSYSNSEILGSAFEYLLSFMGSQGDAGQFRTPRHIIDFIVSIVSPNKNDLILDPACGTSGFLISSYNHILKKNTKKKIGDLLSNSDRNKINNNFQGYDISPDMVKISLSNLFLHHFKNPQIIEYDPLTNEKNWNKYYDVILANPPFMTPKGGIQPHNLFSIKSRKAEQLFLVYILEHLKPNGKCGVIVPEGILENINSESVRNLRKLIIDKGLYAIVSLPVGVFSPYAKSIKTSILFFDKNLKKNDLILYYNINSDGYELGLTRKKIEKDDLPDAKQCIEKFLQGKINEIKKNPNINLLERKIVLENEQKSLSLKNYFKINLGTKYTKIEITEIFDIKTGKLQSNDNTPGNYTFITASNEWKTHNHFTHDKEALIYAVGASGSLGRCHYINAKFITSNLCKILTPKEKYKKDVNLKYFYYFFNEFREHIVNELTRGATKKSIGQKNFGKFLIPFPKIEEQNIIVKNLNLNNEKINKLKEIIQNKLTEVDIINSDNKKNILN
jgi:type I restriction enzyme M protein